MLSRDLVSCHCASQDDTASGLPPRLCQALGVDGSLKKRSCSFLPWRLLLKHPFSCLGLLLTVILHAAAARFPPCRCSALPTWGAW